MSNFLIFKAAFNNSATPAIGTYTAEGATAQFNKDTSISPDYYLYNTVLYSAVQWFIPTAETTDFEFAADILTRYWDNQITYFIIADSTGTTRLRMWSVNDNWHFENSDSTGTTGNPEYIGVINPTTSGGFGVFHQFRVRVRKLTASSSSVEVYVDGTLKLTATAGAALVTCAKIGFVGGVNSFGPGTGGGVKNAYVYDLSGRDVIDRGVLSGAFNRFISWMKSKFALKSDIPTVNDATLTIQKNGTNVATFTANQSTNATANITVPTKTSDLTNDSGFITSDNTKIPLAGSNAISGSLIPSTDATVNLGSSSYMFNIVHSGEIHGYQFYADSTATCIFNYKRGGYISLRGADYSVSSIAGGIMLSAWKSDGVAKAMMLYPNGTWTWEGTAVQLVSDQRLKQQISEIDDKLLDAWEDVNLVQFKYNDAVDQKGKDKARLHTGYVVQQIDKACKSHGVDISEYGLYCHEEYPQETEEIEVEQADGTKVKEKKVISEANEHYSLRYTEVYAVECMYLRRCIARLTARIEELEKDKEQEAGK